MAKFKDVENPWVVVFTWPRSADEAVIDWVNTYKPHTHHHNIDAAKIHPFYLPGERTAIVIIDSAEEIAVRKFCRKFSKGGDIRVQAMKALQWDAIPDFAQSQ